MGVPRITGRYESITDRGALAGGTRVALGFKAAQSLTCEVQGHGTPWISQPLITMDGRAGNGRISE